MPTKNPIKRMRRPVGKEISSYFHSAGASSSQFQSFIDGVRSAIPDTVVFGGMVRDFHFDLPSNFQSDIDLVCMASSSDVERLIRDFDPVKNKFGGFRLLAGKQPVDIWALDQTWAFKQGLAQANGISDLCATTFFNVDAAYVSLRDWSVNRSPIFEEAIDTDVLDVNLEHNPSPSKATQRAISLSVKLGLDLSLRLQRYVLENADESLYVRPVYGTYLKLLREHVDSTDSTARPFRFSPQASLM